ncbi:IS481 family transposase [Flaviflexus salsibiostraticola]|uniref:IS481 family transposase n=1 Tax=Flaviflexus salsibiostraticola TaxID=1282737 RepID=A0A3S8ZBJ3_9ACTO|nr:IS481 family transposase [Flaviflexus salsibiostraticola]AZN30903.1 IS481 family transposase [Flaviflexus salsibiostraticola]
MSHANAPLTPVGRQRLASLIVDQGWSIRRAAERFQVSPATASKWASRYRAGEPLADRSSRPHHSPARLAMRREHRIISLRFTRRWGPHRISHHLGIPRSTVERVLTRYRMPLLAHLDQTTGLPVRKPRPVRYEKQRPGELVHVDIKKLGRIPDGGGHRMLGRANGRRNRRHGVGYAFLHHAVDDYSRLAYSEILADEKKETAAEFWNRARTFFAQAGVTITAVMTDNGSCYRSRTFAAALGPQVKHRRTRPYRPQTNGKVERFNRTLATEWAYAQMYESDGARAATYSTWLHHYNHHRPHTGIGGQTPSDRVHNLTGNYS